MELFEEEERLKIRLLAAYRRMRLDNKITEEELEEVFELIDRLDEYSLEDVQARLERIGQRTNHEGR
ncbi:MAG: hypothetical protein QJR13_00425 [Bacillota bacterium]|nr:hypothetical protein [Bacillota bacterium]